MVPVRHPPKSIASSSLKEQFCQALYFDNIFPLKPLIMFTGSPDDW